MKSIKIIPCLFLIYFHGIYAQIKIADTLKIEEAIISNNRIEVARKNVPLTISSINASEINETQESSVLSIISQRVPGVFVTEKGITGFGLGTQSSGQISIRGVGGYSPNTQILVLVDGHPQYMGIFGHPIPDAYVASDVEKVEIVRGPASLLYGSNAMGGVINIITKEQKEDGYAGNVKAGFGSYNTQKYMINGGFKRKKWDVFASVNYDKTDGHRDSSGFEILNGYIKSKYEINDHVSISADFNLADMEQTDPGSSEDPNPQSFHADAIRGKTSFKIENKYEKVQGGIIAFYNFGKHVLSDGWRSTDANKGITIYQGFKLIKGNRLTVGFDYKNLGGEGNSGVGANKWNSLTEIAGYFYAQQLFFNKLVASGGIRIENNNKYGNFLIPQLGFSYHLTPVSNLKGSFSRGFRSPTVMETYLFMPNPGLKPEELWNYEIGYSQHLLNEQIKTEICMFYIDAANFIEVVPNPEGPPPMKRENSGEFENYGMEFELKYQPVINTFEIAGNYSYLAISSPKLAAPRHQFFTEGVYKLDKLKISLNIKQISGLYTQLNDASQQLEEKTDNFCLVNAKITYLFGKKLEIYLAGKNLLNTKYSVIYGYEMPGLNFMAGINYSFKK